MEMTKKRKPGRPVGSKTEKRPIVTERPANCPTCGSYDRARKVITNRLRLSKTEEIIWSRVQCRECPQQYIIKTMKGL